MELSTEVKDIAAALSKFQKVVWPVTKDSVNPFFKSKYASLENVIETIKEPLVECGLSYAQFPDGEGLTTIVMHISGQWLKATANIKSKGNTAQDQGSAITYMRRYALCAALGLGTEDDDGNSASKEESKTTEGGDVKERIMMLIGKLGFDKEVNEAKDKKAMYQKITKDLTGFDLVVVNFPAIASKLNQLVELKKLDK